MIFHKLKSVKLSHESEWYCWQLRRLNNSQDWAIPSLASGWQWDSVCFCCCCVPGGPLRFPVLFGRRLLMQPSVVLPLILPLLSGLIHLKPPPPHTHRKQDRVILNNKGRQKGAQSEVWLDSIMWHHMISHKRKRARPNKITQNITSHYVHSRITVDKGLSNMWSHWECLQLGISYIHLLSIIRNIIKVLYVIITISVKYISSQILKTMGYIMNVMQIMNLYQESAINFLILALTPFQYKMLTSSVKYAFPYFCHSYLSVYVEVVNPH